MQFYHCEHTPESHSPSKQITLVEAESLDVNAARISGKTDLSRQESSCSSQSDASISFSHLQPVLHNCKSEKTSALLTRSASLCPYIRKSENERHPVSLTSKKGNILGYRFQFRPIFRRLVFEVAQIDNDKLERVIKANLADNIILQCWAGCPGKLWWTW